MNSMGISGPFFLRKRKKFNDEFIFNKGDWSSYLLQATGIDSICLAVEGKLAWKIFKSRDDWSYKGERRSRGAGSMKVWRGPHRGKALWTRFIDVDGDQFLYQAVYIRLQPDHLLGIDRLPAHGDRLISALAIISEQLSEWFIPISISDLLTARLSYLEIAWDVLGLPTDALIELPLKFKKRYEQRDDGYAILKPLERGYLVLKRKRKWYVRSNDKTTCSVIYTDDEPEPVARLEFRFTRNKPVKDLLGVTGNPSLRLLMIGKGLAEKLKGRLKREFYIESEKEIVSIGYAWNILAEKPPRNWDKLSYLLNYIREIAQLDANYKEGFSYVRKYLRTKKNWIIGSHSLHQSRILNFAECLGQAIDIMVKENRKALAKFESSQQ